MYENLKGLKIDKTDARFADFPDVIDGDIYIAGSPDTGWETQYIIVPTVENIKQAVQAHLDSKAVAQGFDDINSISKFMGFDNSFRASAEALALLTANTWAYIESELVKVEAGTRTLPATIDEVIAELPNS